MSVLACNSDTPHLHPITSLSRYYLEDHNHGCNSEGRDHGKQPWCYTMDSSITPFFLAHKQLLMLLYLKQFCDNWNSSLNFNFIIAVATGLDNNYSVPTEND